MIFVAKCMPCHTAFIDRRGCRGLSCALLGLFVFGLCSCHRQPPTVPSNASYEPRVGDIVFQSLNGSELAAVIESATQSPYSHCGIVTKQGDAWMVLEAIGPVQEIPLSHWILRGRNFKYDVFRLDDRYQDKIAAMVENGRAYLGRPYDIQYEFDDEKIYCSELVFKAFKQATTEDLGRVVELGTLEWQAHEAFIRSITGGELPLDRLMITPADLARANQLHPLHNN